MEDDHQEQQHRCKRIRMTTLDRLEEVFLILASSAPSFKIWLMDEICREEQFPHCWKNAKQKAAATATAVLRHFILMMTNSSTLTIFNVSIYIIIIVIFSSGDQYTCACMHALLAVVLMGFGRCIL